MKIAQTSLSAVLSFTVASGAMRVSDPCYDVNTWCAGTLENVLNGKWNAQVAYFKDPDDHIYFQKYIEQARREVEEKKGIFIKSLNLPDEDAFNKLSPEDQEKIKLARERTDSLFQFELDELEKRIEKEKLHPGRPSAIFVWHETVSNDELPTSKEDIDVGVDAGQAGFYDLAEFIKSKESGEAIEEQTYRAICDNSLSEAAWGVVPYAAVSSSGYGDGSYECFTRRNESGQVIQAMIVFIDEGEFDEESEDDVAA